jgi:hypothetical protein
MSGYSAAQEIRSICADYLVVDAVRPNRSARSNSLLTGKITGNISFWAIFARIARGNGRIFSLLRLNSLRIGTGK